MRHTAPLLFVLFALNACADDPEKERTTCASAGCVDADGDGVPAKDDCDDSVQTGATCSEGCLVAYADEDGDGVGSGEPLNVCVLASGLATTSGDCAPTDPAHWDDCDTCVDVDGDGYGAGCNLGADCDDTNDSCHEGCSVFYADVDGDGVGRNTEVLRYSAGEGFVTVSGDCDDTSAACTSGCITAYRDQDEDGVGAGSPVERCAISPGWSLTNDDCDDSPATGSSCSAGCTVLPRRHAPARRRLESQATGTSRDRSFDRALKP